jgi:RNA polymerase sigma-70 factor (ECF subfamily)
VTDGATSRQTPVVELSSGGSVSPDSPGLRQESEQIREFREMFQRELPYVLRILRRLGVSPSDVEDAAHDTFLQVYRHLSDYDPERPLRPWLFGFAFRVAAQRRRRTNARKEVFDATDTRPAPSGDALERLLDHELLSQANAALERVEVARRAVLLAHDVEGFTMPEIATALNISVNTAYSRLRLARQEFTRALRRARVRGDEP